tara:strand:+ start:225 stop:602 length:378 start_codon:yes stop_codon:yes gene_type:complete
MNEPITIMPLNDVHMDHKIRMLSTDLDLLKAAGFEDVSWKDDECSSFHRDSKHNKNHFYEIYINYKDESYNFVNTPTITAMHNHMEEIKDEDGYYRSINSFCGIREAIIACARHEEEKRKEDKIK